MDTGLKAMCIVFVGGLVLGLFTSIGDALNKAEQQAAERRPAAADVRETEQDNVKTGACLAAVDAVMSVLNEPSTAKIPACGWRPDQFSVTLSKDHQSAIVQGQMDAQHTFGMMLRRHWKVKLRKNEQHGWSAVRVTWTQ